MPELRHGPPSNPPDAGARLPALTPSGRELLEVLWRAGRPLTTRQLQDAIARRFPHRAGRKIQTVSTLLVELMTQGWGGRRGGAIRWPGVRPLGDDRWGERCERGVVDQVRGQSQGRDGSWVALAVGAPRDRPLSQRRCAGRPRPGGGTSEILET